MSERLREHVHLLRALHRASPKKCRAILDKHGKPLLMTLCECVKNLFKGVVPLTEKQKKRLRPKEKLMRALLLKKTPLKTKRRIIQRGGFIGALLGPLISIISGLFAPR
jgi:hypothetical protein